MEFITENAFTIIILGAMFLALALVAASGISDYNRRQRNESYRKQYQRNHFKKL